ncbi:MAG: DNA polymerase I [Methylococcaceae bacterium]|nr:DNA polymerase I [Methylococcaceae bacterium]
MPFNPESVVVLVDGSSFLFRAFHALPPLTNSKGHPTGAILGVANMLRKMLDTYPTPHFIVVFDAPGKTFRDDLYPEYKANRPPLAEDLRAQIAPLHELIRAMGIPLVLVEGVEADDVIGTLTKTATASGHSVIISTGDKDMAQLVNDSVILENSMSATRLDAQGVLDKFGVRPDQIIDYLALVGDSVDNIPGVPNVGPKTAAKWLNQFESIDGLIGRAEEIKGKVGENLRACLDRLPLSRTLTTIKCDVALDLSLDSLRRTAEDLTRLRSLLEKYEFSSWLKQLVESRPEANPVKKSASDAHYETVLTEAHLANWIEGLSNADLFAFDTETTSLNYAEALIVGVSFAVEKGHAAYVPLAHEYPGAPPQLDRERVLARLKPLLENPDRAKLGQNLKYDANVLSNHGIELRGITHDTMLESYVLNSTATRHDMDSLALKFLNHQTIHYEDVTGKGAKQIPFQQVPLEEATPYAAEDADITLQLHLALWPRLDAEPALSALYREIEVPLVPVLARMEQHGVLIEADLLGEQSRELAEKMKEIEQEAFKLAGEAFNLGSPKQIQEILYEKHGLPVRKKTPKGQPSTAEAALQDLALDYPLPKLILEHRGMSKLKSTYTDRLPEQINQRTGRVHTSYHQAVAATGRLSSADPNLQNIPIRTAEGRRIRQAFVAPAGSKLVAADYSQIELRIMAHLSDDSNLLQAFAEGLDIHSTTASEVFGVPLDSVTKDQRRSAKAINFGLIYGMSAFGLARQLGIARGEAQSYIDLYFARYPGVSRYMDKTRELARGQGYVETMFGRRLYLPDIRSKNPQQRQYAERTAINAPMQGSAADIIKKAMIDVDRWILESGIAARMIMQVHDELVFEIRDEAVEPAMHKIRELMSGTTRLKVPLLVDLGAGTNWDEAH